MWISGFHIDGFGLFHNQGASDLPKGLVLFTGENESGKTTLMEFIRTVLFGFPRRGSRNEYPPLRGGNHGGRLRVVMHDGRRFTIVRTPRGTSITEDGKATEQAEPADRLLGGIDRQTFERVFAVGLSDLQGLDVLSQEGVRGRLFAAGAGLGAMSVPAALQALDSERGDLLRPRGRQQRINQMVNRLKDIEREIADLRGQAAEYARQRQRQSELEEHIQRLHADAEGIRQRLRRIEQLTQARQPWVRLCAARERAARLEFARSFPPHGLERFESLKREIEGLQRERQAREDEVKRLQGQANELSVDEALVAHQKDIEILAGERQKMASALEDYPSVKAHLEAAEEELSRRLQELGPDWEPARLKGVNTSVQVRQQVQEFGRLLNAADRRYEQAEAYQRKAEEDVKRMRGIAEESQQRLDAAPVPPVTDSRELQQQLDAARSMRGLVYRREVAAASVEAKREALQEAAERLESLRRQEAVPGRSLPAWALLLVLAAAVGAAALVALQGSYANAALVALAGIVMAGGLHWLRRQQVDAEAARRAQLRVELGQVERKRQAISAAAMTLEEQVSAIDASIRQLAARLGIGPPADGTGVEQFLSELERAGERLREWEMYVRERDGARKHLREAEERWQQARRETEEASRERQQTYESWQKWLAERGFSDRIRPEGFEAVLQAVESARAAEQNLLGYRRRLDGMNSYITEARERVCAVLEACGRAPAAREVGVEELDALLRELKNALETQNQRQELKKRLEIAEEEVTRLGRRLAEKQGQLQELLRQAKAAGEEEFRQVAQAHAEWCSCQQEMEESGLTLRTIAGTPEALVALESELAESDPLQLQAEDNQLRVRLKEVTDATAEHEREVGGLAERLSRMAQSERLGELLLEQHSLRQKLSEAVKRWAVLVVCRSLLEQTRDTYERERQPQVIQEADRYLKVMVGDRYRVFAAVGEDSLQLEDAALNRKSEATWSRGLADQVYLATRLGLAREFARHTEPLPVILDDVLVNFDPRRRLGAARVILGFASEQQVLLFSCHPELSQCIEGALGDPAFQGVPVARYTLAGGVLVPAASGSES